MVETFILCRKLGDKLFASDHNEPPESYYKLWWLLYALLSTKTPYFTLHMKHTYFKLAVIYLKGFLIANSTIHVPSFIRFTCILRRQI